MASYRIRDKTVLFSVIFPIFDKYSLLTSKQYNYLKFKEALLISNKNSLSTVEKNSLIETLVSTKPPLDYISPAWSIVDNKVTNVETASKVMSKSWLIGFTEAEGSFYLVSKTNIRIVHAFEITQKLDLIVLKSIKYLLGISTQVQNKKTFYSISTTNSRAIENIIKYFNNTMKGMKSVEYRIWARSYVKNKGNFEALRDIRDRVRIMRKQENIKPLLILTRKMKV